MYRLQVLPTRVPILVIRKQEAALRLFRWLPAGLSEDIPNRDGGAEELKSWSVTYDRMSVFDERVTFKLSARDLCTASLWVLSSGFSLVGNTALPMDLKFIAILTQPHFDLDSSPRGGAPHRRRIALY